MMRTARLFAAPAFVSLLICARAGAAESWKNAVIMPKTDQLQILSEPSGAAKGDIFQIAWPATVDQTEGRWLKIHDDGGYMPNGLAGWVYADDVVKFDDAETYYAERLAESHARWLYWLDGIYWEAKDELALAVADYVSATDSKSDLPQDNRLDDAQIRLGRLRAANFFSSEASRQTDDGLDKDWAQCFLAAQAMNQRRPILWLEWGNALWQSCRCAPRSAEGEPAEDSTGDVNRGATQSTEGAGDGQQGALPQFGFHSTDASSAPTPAAAPPMAAAPPTAGAPPKSSIPEAVAPPSPPPNPAIEAIKKYNEAERLSPRWWSVPFKRAELLLDRCTKQVPKQLVPDFDDDVKSEELTPLIRQCPNAALPATRPAAASQPAALPSPSPHPAAPAVPGAAASTAAASPAKCDRACRDAVLATALRNFDRAINLQPKSPDAYRDRAEVLLLQKRPAQARRSAMSACILGDFRGTASLRLLAQVCASMADYDAAQSYAEQAAHIEESPTNRRVLFVFCNNCSSLANANQHEATDIVSNSMITPKFTTEGYSPAALNSLGDKEDDASPPPGFVAMPFLGTAK